MAANAPRLAAAIVAAYAGAGCYSGAPLATLAIGLANAFKIEIDAGPLADFNRLTSGVSAAFSSVGATGAGLTTLAQGFATAVIVEVAAFVALGVIGPNQPRMSAAFAAAYASIGATMGASLVAISNGKATSTIVEILA
jgi:hypothetical protein